MSDAPSSAPPSRDEIRRELEETREGYHELLKSLSPEDMKKKSGNPAWSVGQLMYHLAWAGGFTAQGVQQCRKGKGLNPPRGIADFLNTWMTRIGSRGATPETMAAKYDEAHQKIVDMLETVQDDDWAKGSRQFGRMMTVESTFRSQKEHLDEHRADINRGLGRV
jgi:hypothetical protein